MIVFLNGQFISENDAKISIFDHGFLYGDGVYETLRTYGGCIWQTEAHVRRLFQSARFIGLKLPWSQKKIVEWLKESVDRNYEVFENDEKMSCGDPAKVRFVELIHSMNSRVVKNVSISVFHNICPEFRIRLTVSRGVNHFDFTLAKHPTICIAPELIIEEPIEIYENGVSAITFPIQRFLPEAKSLNYLPSVLARQLMVRKHAYEAFFVNPLDHVLEGTISNIFLVIGDNLVTPKDGMLHGITRDTILRISPFPVVERKIFKSEFFDADECFLTSTVKGIVPIVKINGKKIGNGHVGKRAKAVIAAFEQYVKKNA